MSFLCCACIDQSERGIVQSCGKFSHILDPGCSIILWPIQTVDGVSIKVHPCCNLCCVRACLLVEGRALCALAMEGGEVTGVVRAR